MCRNDYNKAFVIKAVRRLRTHLDSFECPLLLDAGTLAGAIIGHGLATNGVTFCSADGAGPGGSS
jgi:hypothetical protein